LTDRPFVDMVPTQERSKMEGRTSQGQLPDADAVAVRVSGLTKRFGPVVVLDDISLDVRRGEIRALVGQNGSGKSTLVKVLSGFYEPDGGEITVDGVVGARDSVAAIHQDLCLRDDMTVVENLGLTANYGSSRRRPIRWREERAKARDDLAELGVYCDPRSLVGELAPADRAAVAIARALRRLRMSGSLGVLIVDESTAYFSAREIAVIRDILRRLADDGYAILFVSHNFREVLDVCDSVTVLRNGRVVNTSSTRETDEATLVAEMLGRSLTSFYPDMSPMPAGATPTRFEVRDLTGGRIHGFSVRLHAGEVVGVTGLVGSGFEQLPYLLVGVRPMKRGVIELDGMPCRLTPVTAFERGISLVPANRAMDGLWMEGSAVDNYAITRIRRLSRRGVFDRRAAVAHTRAAIEEFRVHPSVPRLVMSQFSGGNQQKVLLASRLERDQTKVMLLHEPTQGVDSGAKRDILEIIHAAASRGTAALIFSSDHEELVHMCTRLLILSTAGEIVAEMPTAGATEDDILAACIAAG
jgi:ribose transport system ATP-binding protein